MQSPGFQTGPPSHPAAATPSSTGPPSTGLPDPSANAAPSQAIEALPSGAPEPAALLGDFTNPAPAAKEQAREQPVKKVAWALAPPKNDLPRPGSSGEYPQKPNFHW